MQMRQTYAAAEHWNDHQQDDEDGIRACDSKSIVERLLDGTLQSKLLKIDDHECEPTPRARPWAELSLVMLRRSVDECFRILHARGQHRHRVWVTAADTATHENDSDMVP